MRKINNQPKDYLTRSKIAGCGSKGPKIKVSPKDMRRHAEREGAASIDARWYIQLPPKLSRS